MAPWLVDMTLKGVPLMNTTLHAALEALWAGQDLVPVQAEIPAGLPPEAQALAQQVLPCLTAGDGKALMDLCFSPVWAEYKAFLAPLPMPACLTEVAIGLLNALNPETKPLVFQAERTDDMGQTVFQEDGVRTLVYDRFGCQLMTATRSESGTVSGWKKEFRYEGETENGLPQGQGTQYAGTRRMLTGRLIDTSHRTGRWEKGVLVEGTLKDALVIWNGGDLAQAVPMQGPDGMPIQLSTCVLDTLMEKSTPSCSGLYAADLTVGPEGFLAQEPLVPLCPAKGGEVRILCLDCFMYTPPAQLPEEDDNPFA